MISGSAATTGSTNTRTTLSYVNNLVTGATSSGSFHIYIPNDYMDDSMMDTLIGYGYKVTKRNTLMGSNVDYLIDWAPNPTPPTPSPTPSVTRTPTPTMTPSHTPTMSVTPTRTVTPTVTPTATKTVTPTASISPTPSISRTITPTPTITPSTSSTHVAGVDFTIEWWIKTTSWTSPTGHPRPYSLGPFPAPNAVSIENSGDHIYWWTGGSPRVDYAGLGLQTNQWYHMAITRDNGLLAIYVDGQRKATATYNDAIPAGSNDLWIGAEPTPDSYVNGKMTNFRWNASVKYTGTSFTVPTTPLTADANTKLLVLATDSGNLTTDSSPLAKTITNYGTTWDSDSPFVSGGGSFALNGSSYMTVPSSTDWNL